MWQMPAHNESLGPCSWSHIWGSLDPHRPAGREGGPTQGLYILVTEAPKRNYSSSFRPLLYYLFIKKLPGISAFFITRVNICHANKARGYFSPLRNRICNDTVFLMSPTQYNMYLNADERQPVRLRLHRRKSRAGAGGCCGACGSRSLASCGISLGEVLREEGNLQDTAHPRAGAHFLKSMRLEHR